jgi:hypothetical protein
MSQLSRTPTTLLRGALPRALQALQAARAEVTLERVLRVGAGLCFIGHGAFGIITKPAWVPYFAVVGIPEHIAYILMPVIGVVDVLAGITVLASPRPIVLLYMTVWALWTALLRPLSGDRVWETVERAGNYGVPLALIMLVGGSDAVRDWFARVRALPLLPRVTTNVAWILRVTTALLMVGHGALAAVGKPLLVHHFDVIGLDTTSLTIAGGIEIGLAIAVLTRPGVALLVFVACWKLATEYLFVVAGAPVWEFVERAGSYVAPIALAILLVYQAKTSPTIGGPR